MKTVRLAVTAVAILLLAAIGCGSGSEDQDVLDGLIVLDAIGGDVEAGDVVLDTVGQDTATDPGLADQGQGDGAVEDATLPADTVTPDAGNDAVNPDQCQFHQECDNCQLCLDEGDGKKCTMVLWEQAECYNDDDCQTAGDVCRYSIPGKPACGGSCWPDAVYTLHEWGVNTVTLADEATTHAGPLRYYDAVDRKPVIYIYSDESFAVDIGVQYRDGTSSETWPEIPASPWVVWKDVQVGTGGCTPSATPPVDWSGEAPAREVWDLPNWVVDGANCLTYGETVSKLLFYAGPFTGYTPGVEATLTRMDTLAGEVTLTNNLADEIGPVIALYREAESACEYFGSCPVHTALIGWKIMGDVAPGGTVVEPLEWDYLHVDATDQEPYPSIDGMLPSGWTEMPANLRFMLTDKGLTEDEVDRFMAAWTDIMFGLHGADADPMFPEYQSGASLIYLWPDSRTAEKLPLTAVPAPTNTVRAMVEYQQIETVELL